MSKIIKHIYKLSYIIILIVIFLSSINFAFADCGWWYTKSSFTTQDCSYNSGKTVNSDASFCQNSPKPTMYEKRPNDFICCCSKEEKEIPAATVADEGIKKPILQIPIPTITFSDKICSGGDDGGTCRIGWIGEYITGIYKYAVIIIGVVAVIVMMLGGVIWLMSAGNSSQIGEAKKWIGASLSGLVIMLCSYLILFQINPKLTIFEPLEISTIKKIPIELLYSSDSLGGGDLSPMPSGYTSGSTIAPKENITNQYDELIKKYAQQYGLDPATVKAIMATESRGYQDRSSGKGAIGLMQLMPDTARLLKVNPYDTEQNLEGGTRMFAGLIKKYNGDVGQALMAYNWGPGNMDVHLGKINVSKCPTCSCRTQGCTIPSETQGHAATYRGFYNCFSNGLGSKCK